MLAFHFGCLFWHGVTIMATCQNPYFLITHHTCVRKTIWFHPLNVQYVVFIVPYIISKWKFPLNNISIKPKLNWKFKVHAMSFNIFIQMELNFHKINFF